MAGVWVKRPTQAVLYAMADKMHRQKCWRGPSCDDFTGEDLNYAEAIWWLLQGLACSPRRERQGAML